MPVFMAIPRAHPADYAAKAGRPLGWGELCARLAVSRMEQRDGPDSTARRNVLPGAAMHFGSFHRSAAHMLEHIVSEQIFINSTSSANVKDTGATPVVSREAEPMTARQRPADETR